MKSLTFVVTIFLVMVSLIIPFGSAFAYNGGLLDKKPLNIGDELDISSSTTMTLTNGNVTKYDFINLGANSKNKVWYKFISPVTIDAYQLFSAHESNGVNIGFYDINKNVLKVISGNLSGVKQNLEVPIESVSYISLYNTALSTTKAVNEFDVFGSASVFTYDEITNLSFVTSHNFVFLDWSIPSHNINFMSSNVYRDSIKIATLDNSTTTFIDSTVESETPYSYKVSAVYSDGHETEGITKRVTTEEFVPLTDVKNVNVEMDYNRVELSWVNPSSTEFKHVNIYRDEVEKEPNFFKKLFLGVAVSAAVEPTKIFETNGTYFNDLTVQPETTYEYRLTSESIVGEESEGVIVQATTPEEPSPEIKGGGFEKDENGDFIFSWTSPTTGQVKVVIDGKEYKTIDASLRELLIPKKDMKYDVLGNPNVQLIAISESGKEGKPAEPKGEGKLSDAKIPFGPTDLLKSTMGLFGVIAPILLLSLAIIFFRPIKNLIVKAVKNHRERKMYR